MNRVDQIYEDETAIRLVLIGDTDKTNLDTVALDDRRQRPVRRRGVLHDRPEHGCTGGCWAATGS